MDKEKTTCFCNSIIDRMESVQKATRNLDYTIDKLRQYAMEVNMTTERFVELTRLIEDLMSQRKLIDESVLGARLDAHQILD